jgi:hypothetical protein
MSTSELTNALNPVAISTAAKAMSCGLTLSPLHPLVETGVFPGSRMGLRIVNSPVAKSRTMFRCSRESGSRLH